MNDQPIEFNDFAKRIIEAAADIEQRECKAIDPETGWRCGFKMGAHDNEQLERCWKNTNAQDKSEAMVRELRRFGAVTKRFAVDTFLTSDKSAEKQNESSWRKCRAWLQGGKRGLYLWGPPGTGKTFAARAILYQSTFEEMNAWETNAVEMLSKHRRFDMTPYKNGLFRSDIVLIDDIDKPIWKADDLAFFWELLNARSDGGYRTILTSNYHPKKIRSIFMDAASGNRSKIDATLERLAPTEKIKFGGKSLRGIYER